MTCAMVLDVDRSRNVKLEFYHVCSTTGKNASVAGTLIMNSALIRDNLSWGNCMNFDQKTASLI